MLIGGAWVYAESGRTFDTFNPATGELLATVAEADTADVHRAVLAARKAFDEGPWSRMPGAIRARMLQRVAELLESHADELAELETLNNGMPVSAAREVHLPLAVETFLYNAGWCTRIEGKTLDLVRGTHSVHAYTVKEPIGVAGLIIPWNSPVLMAAWKLAPALAAGCCCILKPAEQTPLTALRIGELLLEAGLPPGVINIVPGFGHTSGAALSSHPGVDKIAFTGSTEVGREIVHASAGNLKRVTLELGGKSPVIVLEDADLDQAVAGAAQAIFTNAGQVCAAGSRLYVQRPVYERLLSGVADIANKIRVGDGFSADTEMGPLVSSEQLARVTTYVDSARVEGAEVIAGGMRLGSNGYFMAPTVIGSAAASMRIVREEIFGPVLSALAFNDLDDVVAAANATQYGLAASVWTRDVSKAHMIARRLQAGSIGINAHMTSHTQMPFGGYKQSGWGRENGEAGVQNYLQTKSVYTVL